VQQIDTDSPDRLGPVEPDCSVGSSAGATIAAATVAILDGPDSGKQATADASGRYSFNALQQAGFRVRASAEGFTEAIEGVTLTADRTLDFTLSRIPVAILTFGGDIAFTSRT